MANMLMAFLFTAINAFLILMRVTASGRPLMFKIYGLALPVVFLVAVLIMGILKLSGYKPDASFKPVFFNILMSVLLVIVANLMVLFAGYMLDQLLKFHLLNNAASVSRFPVKFVLQNKSTIVILYKTIFLLGSVLAFYGVWIAKQ